MVASNSGLDSWRFRFHYMQNGQPGWTSERFLFEIPVNQATFSSKLNDVGQFTATVQQSDPAVQAALSGQPSWHDLCERCAVYVLLNNTVVWGGVLQQAQYQSSKHQVTLTGQDFWSYFASGRTISWNASYNGADQLLVAADLINIAQGQSSSTHGPSGTNQSPRITAGTVTGGNIGVQLSATCALILSGLATTATIWPGLGEVTQTQQWSATDMVNVGQAISTLATNSAGFDWTIDVANGPNGAPPIKVFNLWYPRAGRTAQQQTRSGAVVRFDMGGTSGQDYVWQVGQTPIANTVFASGSGNSGQAMTATAADPSAIDQGWPLYEDSVSYDDVQSQQLLQAVANAALDNTSRPVIQPQVVYNVGSGSDQPLGSFAIGDDARLILSPDDYFPNGYDSTNATSTWWRIVEIDTTVNDEGLSNATITFNRPPTIPGY